MFQGQECVFLIWKEYVFKVRNMCSVSGRNMCSLSGRNMGSRSGILCVQYIEGIICVPRSEMCIFYLEGICVPGRQCVFCIRMEHVFFIRKEFVFQVRNFMRSVYVRNMCSEVTVSESGRNYEFHVRNCVLYMEGVCVFDQECGIFFLMEYVFTVRNLSQECLFPDQERAE